MKKIAASRTSSRVKRHERLRLRLSGTQERPRLAIFRSLSHIYAQVIDDVAGRTIASASTMEVSARGDGGGDRRQRIDERCFRKRGDL